MTTKTSKRARLRCPDCDRLHARRPQSLDDFYTWVDPSTGEQRRSTYCKEHQRARAGLRKGERVTQRDALAHERQKQSNRESMRRAREQQKEAKMSSMQDSNWVRWVDDQGVEHSTPLARFVDVRRTPSGAVFVVLDELEIDERYAGEQLMSAASQSVEHRVDSNYAEPLLWYLRTRRSAVDVRESFDRAQSGGDGTK